MEKQLKDIQWSEFRIGNIFTISTGSLLSKEILEKGKIARITATDNNNGIFGFYKKVKHKNYRELTNFISVSFMGSVFYHSYTASLDMKIHAVQVSNYPLNKYLAEFLVLCLKRTVSVFSYGDQLSSTDLPNKRILLPTTSNGQPDYALMEKYMREKEQKKVTFFIEYITKRLDELESYKEVIPLSEKEWDGFYIDDISEIVSGRDIYETEREKGNVPYITSTANNNGIGYLVGNNNQTLEANCVSVNRNGSVGYAFYHQYLALFSNDCRKLRLNNPSKFVGIFISQQITKQKEKYGYGYKMGTARLRRQKIMLPIDTSGQPDYEYMENYMKKIEHQKLTAFLDMKNISL